MSKQKSSKLSKAERQAARANVEPKRFAIIADPPTIVLEYLDKQHGSLRHRKMQLPTERHDIDVIVDKLIRRNNIHLHPDVVSGDQVRRLVTRLLPSLSAGASPPPAAAPSAGGGGGLKKPGGLSGGQGGLPSLSGTGTGGLPSLSAGGLPKLPGMQTAVDPFAAAAVDPFAKPKVMVSREDVVGDKLDLNKADEEVVEEAKRVMDEDFEKARILPGDAAYLHDKRVEFEVVEGPGDWDEDSEDESPLNSPGVIETNVGNSPELSSSPLDVGDDDDMYAF